MDPLTPRRKTPGEPQVSYDTSEPDWWLNGHAPPADWLVDGSLSFRRGDEYVVVTFHAGCSAAEVVQLLTEGDLHHGNVA